MVAAADAVMTVDLDGLKKAFVKSVADEIARDIAAKQQTLGPDDEDDAFTVIVVRGTIAADVEREGAVLGAPVVATHDGDGGHAVALSHAGNLAVREDMLWMNSMFDPGAPPELVGDDVGDDTVREWCLRQVQKVRQMLDEHERYLQEPHTFEDGEPSDVAGDAEHDCRDVVRFVSAYHATLSEFSSSGYEQADRNYMYVLPEED